MRCSRCLVLTSTRVKTRGAASAARSLLAFFYRLNSEQALRRCGCTNERGVYSVVTCNTLAPRCTPTPRALELERDLLENVEGLRGQRRAGQREARLHALEAGLALRLRKLRFGVLEAVRIRELGLEGAHCANGEMRGPSALPTLRRGLWRGTPSGRGLGRRHPGRHPLACRRRHLKYFLEKDFHPINRGTREAVCYS